MLMFIKLLLCSRLVSVYGIVGGSPIDILLAPYQINYGDICAGVLIDKRWVLTSAHCGTNKTFVRVGNTKRLKGVKVQIADHHLHPRYNAPNQLHKYDYDIQLLKLKRNLQLQKTIATVPIYKKRGEAEILVSGWGYEKEKGEYQDLLHRISIYKVPLSFCQHYNQTYYNHTLTDRMFCAGGKGKDACQGDSGTGAVSKGYLIGISSFGYGCARGYPGVYINVTEHKIREWIKKVAGV